MTAKVPPVLRESHIQQTCTEFLQLDGWRPLRTDPVSRREWGKGFGEAGMADYMYLRYLYRPGASEEPCVCAMSEGCACAQVLWIEWKRAKSVCKETRVVRATKAARHQRDWHEQERARGALTWIAGVDFPASIEGFIEFYKGSGLARKRIT